jgi:hypothetical protein
MSDLTLEQVKAAGRFAYGVSDDLVPFRWTTGLDTGGDPDYAAVEFMRWDNLYWYGTPLKKDYEVGWCFWRDDNLPPFDILPTVVLGEGAVIMSTGLPKFWHHLPGCDCAFCNSGKSEPRRKK